MTSARRAILAFAVVGSLVLAVAAGCGKIWGFSDGALSSGTAGQPCDNSTGGNTPCADGFICVGGQGDNQVGTCEATCTSDNDCPTNQRCLEQCSSVSGTGGSPYGCAPASEPCSNPGSCNGGPCECPCGETCADDRQCRNSCANGGGSSACPGGQVCLRQSSGSYACYGTSSAHDPDVQEGAVAPTSCTGDNDCPSGERCLQQNNAGTCPQGNCNNNSLVCVPENQPCTNPCSGNCACPVGTICGNDGQCRNSCQFGSTSGGCPTAQVCVPLNSCSTCPGACYGTSPAHDPDAPDAGDQGERWLVVTTSGTYVTDPGGGNATQLDSPLGYYYAMALSPGGNVGLGVTISSGQSGAAIYTFTPGDAGPVSTGATGEFPSFSSGGGAFYYLELPQQGGCGGAAPLLERALGADGGTVVGSFNLGSICGPQPNPFTPGLVVSETSQLAATLGGQGGSQGEQVVFTSTNDAGVPPAPGTGFQFVFGSASSGFLAANYNNGQNQIWQIGWAGSARILYPNASGAGNGNATSTAPPCAPHRIGASGNFYCNYGSGLVEQYNLNGTTEQALPCVANGQACSIVDVVEP